MNNDKIKQQLSEIRNELAYIRGMIENVSHQMQELQSDNSRTPIPIEVLRMPQSYEHPWWKYQRQGSKPRRISKKLGKNYTIKEEDPTLD